MAALLSVALLALAACDPGTVYDTPYSGAPVQTFDNNASVPRLTPGTSAHGGNVTVLGASPYAGSVQMGGGSGYANQNTAAPGAMPTVASSASGDELAFVTSLLTDMQLRSYATGHETCGYIGRNLAGQMMASDINIGSEASCYLPSMPANMRVIASVHTHGTYSPRYASEFPTVQDMTTDAADGINGYISTPGGRLWYVDTGNMSVRQLCGRGCLPQDPRYRPEDDGPVRQSFTLQELRAWENG